MVPGLVGFPDSSTGIVGWRRAPTARGRSGHTDQLRHNASVSSRGARQAVSTRVRMVAEPESVPAVRRFVDDVLTEWGRRDLVEDVGLSVTELATNATLHSRAAHFDVELHGDPDAVRLAVVDTGATRARAIASRTSLPSFADEDLAWESMTGRGLFIVSALATRWGIEDLPGGTRIWADFSTRGSDYQPQDPVVDSRCEEAAAAPARPTTVIRLLGCPSALLLTAVAAAEEIVEVVRSLLITMAAPAPVQEWRDCVEAKMLQQTASARTPVPFGDFRG